jgi:glycosyltransferase involved in cell wall biosynthesis
LPPERKPSFWRQLESLAAVWKSRGNPVLVGGPFLPEPSLQAGAKALIALGYPDQFPFLQVQSSERLASAPRTSLARGLPCFLWSQFSRPPRTALPELPTYVPLTAKTASFLLEAGCCRIGPVIPHGVDTGRFTPPTPEQRRVLRRRLGWHGAFAIGSVGNNTLRKRFDLIIRSFALFARTRLDSRLIIKTDRLVSLDGVNLPELIAAEHLADRVELIVAELSDSRMSELYQGLDLYLNLSEWEGFCIPVIEALACGLPVVTLPIQGPGEILPHGGTLVPDSEVREEDGTILFKADPEAVCHVLRTVAEGTEIRKRLSREGREAALARYDIRQVAQQWEALLP